MAHCPQCGKACDESFVACPQCGHRLRDPAAAPAAGAAAPARTMVGVVSPFAGGVPAGAVPSGPSRNAPPAGSAAPLRTMVGMPAAVNYGGRPPGGAEQEADPTTRPSPAGARENTHPLAPPVGAGLGPARTMVGVPPPAGVVAAARAAAAAQLNDGPPADPRLGPNTAILGSPAIRIRPEPPASTMIGVAMPGIAPTHDPSEGDDEVHADERPSQELGATIAPGARHDAAPRSRCSTARHRA
ncbi:MAG: hypothetical protein WKG00_11920 [Polyangiaceae bacterium]